MDLKNPRMMYLKAVLFLGIGVISLSLIYLYTFDLKILMLSVLSIWSFSRLYYFLFYVIEKYIDPSFRFDGLISVARHLCRSRR
jgi:hypothetical protein